MPEKPIAANQELAAPVMAPPRPAPTPQPTPPIDAPPPGPTAPPDVEAADPEMTPVTWAAAYAVELGPNGALVQPGDVLYMPRAEAESRADQGQVQIVSAPPARR